MRLLPILLTCAAAATIACAPRTTPPPAADVAIANVNIVDVAAGTVLGGRTVLVRDGRIATIAPAEDERAAADVARARRTIDGTGRYLIPGLWDMHVHFRGGDELIAANRELLPLYIANGVTTVRDAGGDMTEAVLAWRRAIVAGTLIGPRILTSGPKLDGPTGGWEGSIRLSSPQQVPAALDSLQAIGTDYVKIYDGTISRDVFLAVVREADRRDMIATGHMPYSVRFAEAIDAGLDATEHLYYAFKGSALNEDSVTRAVIATAGSNRPLGFWAALSLLQPQYDAELADRTFRHMAARGSAVVPTLHIGHVLSYVDEVDHSSDPELRFIDPGIVETYAGRVRSAQRSSPAARAERRALQQRFVEMVPLMHAAGVTVLAGSDAGASNSHVYPGFSLHAELEELVGAGLSPADALRAATVDAATFMRRGHEYGQVQEGYRADLVLLGANPLDDIRNTRTIEYVVFDGHTVHDRAALERLLEDVAR